MFQRAVDLGLPASFVELRHEATHRELPSLVVLRSVAQRSLVWLWSYYWAKIDQNSILHSGITGKDALLLTIRKIIRETLEADEEENRNPARRKRRLQRYRQSFAAAQLASICKDTSEAPFILSRVLLEDSILIPAGRKCVFFFFFF